MSSLRTLATLSILTSATWPQLALAAPTEPNSLANPLNTPTGCQNCHSYGNIEPHGDAPYYAPFFGWRGSMMANASRDPVFWAGVAIASQDDADETILCVRCHSPRAFLEGRGGAISIDELQPSDLDGVECEVCHRSIAEAGVEPGNAQYTIDDVPVNGTVPRRGPFFYETEIGAPPHEWIQDPTLGDSRLCGTCHDVTTTRERVDDDGNGLGFAFNEQRTYSEWLGSAFALPGEGFRSCQDCHMAAMTEMPGCFENANAGITHATGGRRHDLAGANRFVLELLKGIYGTAGTDEIPDFFYDNALELIDLLLPTAATVELVPPSEVDLSVGLSGLEITVTNNTGHKLPTGYSEGRVMWLEVVGRYGDEVVYSSGRYDAAAGIEQDGQLRTYRAIADDQADGTTFHLLRNNHWVEDTRIPPRGLSPDPQTDPVGDRYTLGDDGAWPNFDIATYAFPAAPEVVDATPENADDDVLTIDVRLLYLINTPEYVQFLADENVTNSAGMDVLALFEDAGGAPPLELVSAQVTIPITGFGPSAASSSGTGADTTAGASASTSASGPSSSTGAATTASEESGSGGDAASEGGGGGCSCATPGTGGSSTLLPLGGFVLLARRRRRRA